ncbi:hypothetical protein JAAARDRAFT_130904 [Jaapia argillacea MUCL 33604]|uniref:RecQ-mediated genome instability protein 1 n=1 Tax=Jaapia argillacea MUCL 33604 TaxID=933084 RepID=A0A067Q3C0_9AGAM|nr:hypothetical protein JAAARDRAFT_130904 [Jaapia argillacea MUCL 33604]
MLVPPQVVQWVKRHYPKPQVDPEWLSACYQWVVEELHLNPSEDFKRITSNIESQLLQSDLSNSMLANTGFPRNVLDLNNQRLTGPAILVEVISIMEIGQSAFSLQNVRQTRLDRADLAGLGEDNGEDEGPVPNYPRSMLEFELSDGTICLKGMEYRRLPDFQLGVTPLGAKVSKSFHHMFLSSFSFA